MECNVIREISVDMPCSPDSASLHPGYVLKKILQRVLELK